MMDNYWLVGRRFQEKGLSDKILTPYKKKCFVILFLIVQFFHFMALKSDGSFLHGVLFYYRSKAARQGQRGPARTKGAKSGQKIKPRMGQQFFSRFHTVPGHYSLLSTPLQSFPY
jgi:hypothetical protein